MKTAESLPNYQLKLKVGITVEVAAEVTVYQQTDTLYPIFALSSDNFLLGSEPGKFILRCNDRQSRLPDCSG